MFVTIGNMKKRCVCSPRSRGSRLQRTRLPTSWTAVNSCYILDCSQQLLHLKLQSTAATHATAEHGVSIHIGHSCTYFKTCTQDQRPTCAPRCHAGGQNIIRPCTCIAASIVVVVVVVAVPRCSSLSIICTSTAAAAARPQWVPPPVPPAG